MKTLRLDGKPFLAPLGKVVCVGRNYAEHARELNNPIPEEPLLFMKPATAVCDMAEPLKAERFGEPVHFETELALLIGQPLAEARPEDAWEAVAGIGLALDLTLRGAQSRLKAKGHPWELAKAFDGACPLSDFVSSEGIHPDDIRFELRINDNPQQLGDARDMLTPIPQLLAYMSRYFTLEPGDVILTGTPAGVGALKTGDNLVLSSSFGLQITTSVT